MKYVRIHGKLYRARENDMAETYASYRPTHTTSHKSGDGSVMGIVLVGGALAAAAIAVTLLDKASATTAVSGCANCAQAKPAVAGCADCADSMPQHTGGMVSV